MIIRWIPYIGYLIELTAKERYLSKPENTLVFFISGLWHGLWLIGGAFFLSIWFESVI